MFSKGKIYSKKFKATDEVIRQIADISGDINPIHLDDDYASSTIFGKRIAHALFCINGISMIIGNYFPGKGAILLSQSFNYRHPVYIDDEIEIKIEVTDTCLEKNIYVLDIECKNQNDEIVLLGQARIRWEP